jgi:hypothetical protein
MTTTYDIDYFIAKFSAIPDELWCTWKYTDGAACCALGHCGERASADGKLAMPTSESTALADILGWAVPSINDGAHDYDTFSDNSTPKSRILAALEEAKS